jgi:hypothetical protein
VHIRKSLSVTNKLKLPKNGKMRYVVLPAQAREALEGLPRYEGRAVGVHHDHRRPGDEDGVAAYVESGPGL